MYDLFACFAGNETSALEFADVPGVVSSGCFPACATINGQQTPFAFYSPQWSSLYGWMSNGNSSYNAAQFSLRHAMTHGLQFDVNYTYSRSIDAGSNAERINQFEGGGFASQVINSWSPKQLRGVSDFDATHQINSNWVWELPFGVGKRYGSGMGKFLNAFVEAGRRQACSAGLQVIPSRFPVALVGSRISNWNRQQCSLVRDQSSAPSW